MSPEFIYASPPRPPPGLPGPYHPISGSSAPTAGSPVAPPPSTPDRRFLGGGNV